MKSFLKIILIISFLVPSYSFAYEWVKIADDMEIKEIPVRSNPIFTSNLLLIKTNLENFKVKAIRAQEYGKKRMDVKNLALKSNALVAINANFFDEYGNALGLVINRGRKFNRMHRGGGTLTGVFYANRVNIKIVDRNNVNESSILEAVQSGPRLIENGKILDTKNSFSKTKRSGVCIDNEGKLVIFCTTNAFSGISLDTLKKVLVSKEVSCIDALNFDGGGSSQIYISNKIPNMTTKIESRYIPGNDNIPVALGIFAK